MVQDRLCSPVLIFELFSLYSKNTHEHFEPCSVCFCWFWSQLSMTNKTHTVKLGIWHKCIPYLTLYFLNAPSALPPASFFVGESFLKVFSSSLCYCLLSMWDKSHVFQLKEYVLLPVALVDLPQSNCFSPLKWIVLGRSSTCWYVESPVWHIPDGVLSYVCPSGC